MRSISSTLKYEWAHDSVITNRMRQKQYCMTSLLNFYTNFNIFSLMVITKHWLYSLCSTIHPWTYLISSGLYLPLPSPYIAFPPPLWEKNQDLFFLALNLVKWEWISRGSSRYCNTEICFLGLGADDWLTLWKTEVNSGVGFPSYPGNLEG